jgi:hypothetical protein
MTGQDVIGKLNDSDDLTATDAAGITKILRQLRINLETTTGTHERSSTRKLDTPLRGENFRARDKQRKSELRVRRGLDNPQQGLAGREHRKEQESGRWACHERTKGARGFTTGAEKSARRGEQRPSKS